MVRSGFDYVVLGGRKKRSVGWASPSGWFSQRLVLANSGRLSHGILASPSILADLSVSLIERY